MSKQQQEEEQEEEEPPQKSIRRGCSKRLIFDTKTTQGLLAEFMELGVQITHVTRK